MSEPVTVAEIVAARLAGVLLALPGPDPGPDVGPLITALQKAVDSRARELDPYGEQHDGGVGAALAEVAAGRAAAEAQEAAEATAGRLAAVFSGLAVAEPAEGPQEDAQGPVPPAAAVDPLALPRNERGAYADNIGFRGRPRQVVGWAGGRKWRYGIPGLPDVEPDLDAVQARMREQADDNPAWGKVHAMTDLSFLSSVAAYRAYVRGVRGRVV